MASSTVLFSRRLASQFPEYAQKLQSDDPVTLRTSLLDLGGKIERLRQNIGVMQAQKSTPAKTILILEAGKKLAALNNISSFFRSKLALVSGSHLGTFDGSTSVLASQVLAFRSEEDIGSAALPEGTCLQSPGFPLLDGPLEDVESHTIGALLAAEAPPTTAASDPLFPGFANARSIDGTTLCAPDPLELSAASSAAVPMESSRRGTVGSLATLDPRENDSVTAEGRGRLDTFASSEGGLGSRALPSALYRDPVTLSYKHVSYADPLSQSEIGHHRARADRVRKDFSTGSPHSLDDDDGVLVERHEAEMAPPVPNSTPGLLSRAYDAFTGMFRK